MFSADREGIKAAIAEISDQVNECYSAWLKSNPALGGRVVVSFMVNPPVITEGEEPSPSAPQTAQIDDAELIVDDVAHPMMSGCILNSIEGLRFEAVEEPLSVRYPFSLSAGPSSSQE